MTKTHPLATRKEVAEFLQVPVELLAQWAHRGKGPRYTRLSGRVTRYRWEDVHAWLDAQSRGGEQAADAHSCA